MGACKTGEKLDKYHFYHNKWILSLTELLAADSETLKYIWIQTSYILSIKSCLHYKYPWTSLITSQGIIHYSVSLQKKRDINKFNTEVCKPSKNLIKFWDSNVFPSDFYLQQQLLYIGQQHKDFSLSHGLHGVNINVHSHLEGQILILPILLPRVDLLVNLGRES